jgi:hypothetical protein
MRYRIYFLLVTAFFVTMNVLLWRSEFGGRSQVGTSVPAELVWEKVLTSPDNSFLEIRHHGVKIGHAHWAASIGEEPAPESEASEELDPEGMIKRLTGYSLDFDGSVSLDDLSRLRFNIHLKLNTNQNWRQFSLKLSMKPMSWEIQSSADEQTVRYIAEEDTERTDRTYAFADLRNPEKLIRELGGPTLPAALAAFGVPLPQANPGSLSIALKWQAHNDRLKVGSNPIRVYRLEARLFDRFKATLFVSPVGEILRLELPDEIVLTNDALTSL